MAQNSFRRMLDGLHRRPRIALGFLFLAIAVVGLVFNTAHHTLDGWKILELIIFVGFAVVCFTSAKQMNK